MPQEMAKAQSRTEHKTRPPRHVDGCPSEHLTKIVAVRAEFEDRCEVQLCAFAQLPLFSGDDGGEEVRKLVGVAARMEGIDVLGSTPYVEQDEAKQEMNMRWITSLALANGKHLDLYLDYFLEEHRKPMI